MTNYFCLDCNYPRELNIHGRCDTCNSDSVCISSTGNTKFPKLVTGTEVNELIYDFEVLNEKASR